MGNAFHENLKVAREKTGFNQKEVADKIEVAKSTYSLYESGKREPGVPIIKKIADVLNISADELLGIKHNEAVTIAAHFDGDDFSEEELDEINNYVAFVKSRRKNNGE